ncbi:hypothetical protein COV24_02920 [candidate division WWE3 bacterium CG10_big_fil_rev_8_21_14_0_10_32_10]|uniref:SHSP domain-containing protein n=1 Tax=candidate division WWE3 bacterium CG10_big_fil_rev_8_21_14_0_10_32_10 TaxID=1975090 RepID=A0A2H0RA29_UNCKA|nr:MAG: hypothetical protein COV24_02920 [candidate division WWE3 bacterium CG10_big_fil_rev_8_21_14_0_10_32_10]
MAIIKYRDPFSPMVNSWFDDVSLFDDDTWNMSRNLQVEEDENEVTVKAPVYGVDPKDVNVKVQGNVLRISGHASKEDSKKDKKELQATLCKLALIITIVCLLELIPVRPMLK